MSYPEAFHLSLIDRFVIFVPLCLTSTLTMAITHTDYNNQGHVAFALAIVFIAVEILCVILRFWARKIGKVPLGADDILIIPSLITCVGICVCSLGESKRDFVPIERI